MMQRLELLFLGHEHRRRLVGPHDARRVRIERHGHGRAATLGSAALHTLDDLQMAPMQAVEIAEGEHGMYEPGRPHIIWVVEDLHYSCQVT
jgi:hypothetical protein